MTKYTRDYDEARLFHQARNSSNVYVYGQARESMSILFKGDFFNRVSSISETNLEAQVRSQSIVLVFWLFFECLHSLLCAEVTSIFEKSSRILISQHIFVKIDIVITVNFLINVCSVDLFLTGTTKTKHWFFSFLKL